MAYSRKQPAGRLLSHFGSLLPAEAKIIEACQQGALASLDASRPDQADASNTVRAKILRFLVLGGDQDHPVHEHGLRVHGAWIEGELDLEGAETSVGLRCEQCSFSHAPILRGAHIRGDLVLADCGLPGVSAERLVCSGNVLIRRSSIEGEVKLVGARIGGDLVCSDATIYSQGKCALCVDGAVIDGTVFLNKLGTQGEVRLVSAQIGGDLVCSASRFDGMGRPALSADRAFIKGTVFLDEAFNSVGDVRLLGAHVTGDIECANASMTCGGGNVLSADHLRVDGALIVRALAKPLEGVSLASAKVGVLLDEPKSWGGPLVLDGFEYGAFAGAAPTDAVTRLKWLDLQHDGHKGFSSIDGPFRPQPWRQLHRVLKEMGHTEDARQVAIAHEHRLRRADLVGRPPAHWGGWRKWPYRLTARTLHWAFWLLAGYGYRPMRLLAWFAIVWLGSGTIYWIAASKFAVFGPSNPLVFQRADYAACVPGSPTALQELAKPPDTRPAPVKGAGNWYLCESLPEEYTGLSPLAYSLDVILPFVDLQQEKDWGPLIPTPQSQPLDEFFSFGWKQFTRLVVWAETLFGWVAGLLLVAIVSGLAKRRED